MPEPSHRPDAASRDDARDRSTLGRKWAYVLHSKVFLPQRQSDLERELLALLDAVCAAVRSEPLSTAAAHAAGKRLVALGCAGDAAIECTMDLLGPGLVGLPEFQPVERFAARIALVVGVFGAGFAAAGRQSMFEQQENVELALLKAIRDARRSEATFEEVVDCSANGVMITGLDGELVRVNDALAGILGYSPAELTGLTLFDIVHPDYAAVLREDYQSLAEGRRERLKQPQSLLCRDGEVARITLTASLLRNEGEPNRFLTVVEDDTELLLLQSELNRQALHDVLTGLPNRQYFSTQIETALRRADPHHSVTLFHLDLDGFAMIGNGLGRYVGDRLLVVVSQRLRAVVMGEKAIVARFDGDEFGILVENTPTTPGVARLVALMNDELSEPVYVEGNGVAVSASVGVVHRPATNIEPMELLRAADFALRRAKAAGRGQWELFDPEWDARDRRNYTLAACMPGAWETGEIDVVYRPVADLASGAINGVEALLRWRDTRMGSLAHARCVELAEQTGFILPLGEWMLRVAAEQAAWWRKRFATRLPLVIGLTAHQAADADLASRLLRTAGDPARLIVGFPVSALRSPDVVENMKVLMDMGVEAILDDFGTAPGELALLADIPVRSVRISGQLVARVSGTADDGPLSTALRSLVDLVHRSGATVIVDGVHTTAQAEWWRLAGADTAMGDVFGQACTSGELVTRLS
jgi:diguanylate cyclase (GGDEF)-like protein/PAS domain S-box-containing protein